MPSPNPATCLPLMREVDSPQAKTEGEKQEEKILSPSLFATQKSSPLVRGGQGCSRNRICGGEARCANERKFDEPIGSAGCRS